MARKRFSAVHVPGVIRRLLERLRGREQLLVRGEEELPLLLLSVPTGQHAIGEEVAQAYAHTFQSLREETRAPYRALVGHLPALVVVLLRPHNVCDCLGHHHPPGTESKLTRHLQADLGRGVGEIDLAHQGIRAWRPLPLSNLAVSDLGYRFEPLHFQAAILAVLLHELEHLAFPEHEETEIRARSSQFYASALAELIQEVSGESYGMASLSPRP